MADNKHILWLDYAKIVGIYLVVIGHGQLLPPEGRQYIYAFHMPLFFIISGMFYRVKPYKKFWDDTVRRMIIPYFIINLICLAIKNLGRLYLGNWDASSFFKQINAILMGIGYRTGICEPLCSVLWFVVALVILYILFNVSENGRYVVILTTVCVTAFLVLSHFGVDLYIPIDSAFLAAPFFCFGMYAKNFFLSAYDTKYTVLGGAILLMLCYVLNSYNGRVDINTCNYGRNVTLFYVGGIAGASGLLMLCKSIPMKVNLSGFAKGTFLIMGFNLKFISLFTAVFHKVLPSMQINTAIGMAIGMVILLCFKPIISLCSSFFPAILGNR